MTLFRIIETIHYEVEARSPEEAEFIVGPFDKREGQSFVTGEERVIEAADSTVEEGADDSCPL